MVVMTACASSILDWKSGALHHFRMKLSKGFVCGLCLSSDLAAQIVRNRRSNRLRNAKFRPVEHCFGQGAQPPKNSRRYLTLGSLDQEHENARRKNNVTLEMRYIGPVFREHLPDLLERGRVVVFHCRNVPGARRPAAAVVVAA